MKCDAQMKPAISIQTQAIEVLDQSLFNQADQADARLFARRVLGVPGVTALTLEPVSGKARIGFEAATGEREAFLKKLAEATRTHEGALAASDLPEWGQGEIARWVKSGSKIVPLQVDLPAAGQLVLTLPVWGHQDPDLLVQTLVKPLSRFPGVSVTKADTESATPGFTISFNPALTATDQLIRAIERGIILAASDSQPANPALVPMAVSGTTVGISTVGEFLLPVATPLAAGILIATNAGVVREAATQLGRGKIGVPLFHTALLTCSIVTGQVLAFALTDLSLRYWQRRWRRQVVSEAQGLVAKTVSRATGVRWIDGQGQVLNRAPAAVSSGMTVRALAGESLLFDGKIVAGEALLDETGVCGAQFPVRKSVGDPVLAGSLLLAGGLDIVVTRALSDSRAARIAAAISRTASGITSDPSLHAKAEHIADKTALPTLATAGVGWVAGDLITVGAILHQDWVSGPALAVPLITLRNVGAALKYGAVIQNPGAFSKIAACDFVVLDGDDPQLSATPLEVTGVSGTLPENTGTLLRHVASAGIYLGGELALALLEACRSRDLIVRQAELLALEPEGVLAQVGDSRLHLVVEADSGVPVLRVALNGKKIGDVSFGRSAVPAAAVAVKKLQDSGLQVFMLSAAAEAETGVLARSLGVTLCGSEMNPAERLRFLDGLKRRGVRALYAGRVTAQPEINAYAAATVAVESLEDGSVPADVVMMGNRYGALPQLIEHARRYDPDIHQSTRMAAIPNLLCVAGGFGGLLNGITSGIIANVGVINVDRHIQRRLASRPR